MASKVDPTNWLPTTFRALKSYLEENLDTDIYDIVGSFAEADDLARNLPLRKVVIHFEIDDIDIQPLGFGVGLVNLVEHGQGEATEEYGEFHILNIDIGVWASDFNGGVTARMVAWQRLCDLLTGHASIQAVREATDIEIRHFKGGRFDVERVNDQRVFRVVDSELLIRVAGKNVKTPKVKIIEDIEQDPNLWIHDVEIDDLIV